MFGLEASLDNLEIKRAICLIFRLINTVDSKDTRYSALKEIVEEFEKCIIEYNELVDKFDKTGKF